MNLWKYNFQYIFLDLSPHAAPRIAHQKSSQGQMCRKCNSSPNHLNSPFQAPPRAELRHKSLNLPDGTILQAFGQMAFCKLCFWTNSTKPFKWQRVLHLLHLAETQIKSNTTVHWKQMLKKFFKILLFWSNWAAGKMKRGNVRRSNGI